MISTALIKFSKMSSILSQNSINVRRIKFGTTAFATLHKFYATYISVNQSPHFGKQVINTTVSNTADKIASICDWNIINTSNLPARLINYVFFFVCFFFLIFV